MNLVTEFNRLNRPGITAFLMKKAGLSLSELNAKLRDDSFSLDERERFILALREWEREINK